MDKAKLTFGLKLCLMIGLAAASSIYAEEAPPLRIRADSWMPFNGDPAAKQPGYVVEFLREVFEPQGIKVDYQIMPWAAAVKAAEDGEIDGIIGANQKEAANLVTGDVSIAEPQFALFTRKENAWKYDSIRSLQGIRLGAIEGYSYWSSLDGYIKKSSAPALKLYTGENPLAEAMTDLVDGKIDVMPESVLVFVWMAKSTGRKFADFRIAYSETAEPLYVAFSKNEQGRKYARMFDAGLRKLKDSGRFDVILSSYGFAKQ